MGKESNKLCFVLNDKKLYLETNLVYFNEIPIFFVCSDLKDCYYLVLNIDINNLEYIIVESTKENILNMLTQKITMRDAILSSSFFWNIKTMNDIKDDIIEFKDIEEIDYDILPDKKAKYYIADEDNIQNIVKKLLKR